MKAEWSKRGEGPLPGTASVMFSQRSASGESTCSTHRSLYTCPLPP